MNYSLIFFLSTFLSDYIEHNSNKVSIEILLKLSKGHNRRQQKDKNQSQYRKCYMVNWSHCVYFFFARNTTDKKQKTPQILSKDFACVKTIPNVWMVQCRLKDNTQVLWIICSTITFSSQNFTRICKCTKFLWQLESGHTVDV